MVVSNNELTSVRVQNFKKMKERRATMSFGILYETPQNQVREVPEIVKAIFDSLEGLILIELTLYPLATQLSFRCCLLCESSKMVDYLDVQQAFGFALLEQFAARGIEFAYPTQTIYTKSAN